MSNMLPFLIIFLIGIIVTPNAFAETANVPAWIKNNAGWWASDMIDDSSFLQGIQYLIKEGIMVIPPTETTELVETQKIPSWIKNNAGWWANGQIDDNSFVLGIQWLVSNGIIVVEGKLIHTDEELRVAFIGDQGLSANAVAVLNLIKHEGAHMVLHQGDFDYSDDPDAWDRMISNVLGDDFPYFGTIGTHDKLKWIEYQQKLFDRVKKNPDAKCIGELGVKSSCTYMGLFFVQTGPGLWGSDHGSFIENQLKNDDHAWRVCSWSGNMTPMQIGEKENEVGWEVYENCKNAGAVIATAHEHSYSRTKTLIDIENQIVDTQWSEPDKLKVDEGSTFVFVSGLGGTNIRDQDRCLPVSYPYGCNGEWASVYTSDQDATYGALFCTFNTFGQPNKAYCYFKNIDGNIIDEFIVTNFIGVDDTSSNLHEADYSGKDLSGKDLAGMMLVGADLSNSNLSNADLSGTTLIGADLSNAILTGADLTGTVLANANLSGTVLTDVDISRTVLRGADFTSANLTGVDLSGLDLSRAIFDRTDLSHSNLADAYLYRTILAGVADLTGTVLTGTDISHSNLTGADLSNKDLTGTVFDDADLTDAILPDHLSENNFSRATLNGVDLSGKDLSNSDFSHSKLDGANMKNADLTGAKFVDVDFTKIKNKSLAGADLTFTSLAYSNLSGVSLDGAILLENNFKKANLSGIDFTVVSNASIYGSIFHEADLSNANFEGMTLSDGKVWVQTLLYEKEKWEKYADKSNAELTEIFFGDFPNKLVVGTKIVGDELEIHYLYYTSFNNGNLHNANFFGTYFGVSKLVSATLTDADLRNADLTNSNLREADLTGANLQNTIVDGVKLEGAILKC